MRSGESFFQMVTCSKKLEIPEEFVSRVGGSVGENWVLVDENCKPCRVEVLRERNRYCLRRGWSDFYRHNSLRQGEMLMFRHQSQNEFSFKIFCERGQGPPVVKVKEENEDDDTDDEEDNDTDEEEEDGDYNEEVDEEDTKEVGAVSKKKDKRTVPDYYRVDIFKSGLATKPNNPYFVSQSRARARKNELYIPKEVIEDYHLKFPEKLFLVDEQGRKFEAKLKLWKDGRVWCNKGWKNICRVNSIGMSDPCICEFVRGSDGMCIRVHRVGMV